MARIRSLCLLVLALVAALALVYCGGGGGGGSYNPTPTDPVPPPSGSSGVHIVQVRDNSYEPKSLSIKTGETVRWVFTGTVATHTVTAKDGSFDSGFIFTAPNAVYERKFDQGGTFEYSCRTHSNCCLMRGSVRVGDNAPPPDPSYE